MFTPAARLAETLLLTTRAGAGPVERGARDRSQKVSDVQAEPENTSSPRDPGPTSPTAEKPENETPGRVF